MITDDSEVFGIRDAATFLGAHEQTVRRLARRGAIPAFKVGKDWRFRKQALLKWIQQQGSTNEFQDDRAAPLQPTPPGSIADPIGSMLGDHTDAPCSVLIIDDEETMCKVLVKVVGRFGCRARYALTGTTGLELVSKDVPDLILLDLMMPHMTGPQFLKRLRETYPDLPVVIITGYPDSKLMYEAMQHGPLLVLPKPVDRKLLERTMRVALNTRREIEVA